MMKTSNYVKCVVEPDEWFTKGKVYELVESECVIIDDTGDEVTIIPESCGDTDCAFLGELDTWKYCDKDGNLLN